MTLELIAPDRPVKKRRPMSPRLRFKILRRDGYACRYCGRRAPDVVLHVDHIQPVALGGSNDPANLITACQECNAGKGISTACVDRPGWDEMWDGIANDGNYIDALEAWGMSIEDIPV